MTNTCKAVEYEGDGDVSCGWYTYNGSQGFGKDTAETGDQWKNPDNPDNSIFRIS